MVPLATGLFHPWSLAFPDARTILVTERNGRLRMLHQRIRDIHQGPDGFLYVATERTFRGNEADGTVLRIEPAD